MYKMYHFLNTDSYFMSSWGERGVLEDSFAPFFSTPNFGPHRLHRPLPQRRRGLARRPEGARPARVRQPSVSTTLRGELGLGRWPLGLIGSRGQPWGGLVGSSHGQWPPPSARLFRLAAFIGVIFDLPFHGERKKKRR